ncbi:MAG: hypothetical protein ACI9VR_003997 [Cognaticolwellia sp.]|jgi:hypothetical protein
MESITITYSLSQEEYLRASAQLWDHRAVGDYGNWVLVALIGSLGGFLVFEGAILGWGALLVAGSVAGLTLSRRFFWRSAYKLAHKYEKPITVLFKDEVVETTTWLKNGTVPYSTYKTYLMSEEFLLLLIDSKRFSILPKSAFEKGDLDRLLGHLEEHLKPEHKRWF